jgi:methanogenic corrinoid protein MtbC1
VSTNERFAAQILDTSAAGLAGMAASLLLERRPEMAERYAPDGFSAWKEQYERWLLDLSAALAAAEPALFESGMRLTRRAFDHRGAGVEDLRSALDALRDTLRERLPEASANTAVPYVERALDALSDSGSHDESEPETLGRSALAYLQSILEGRPRDAIDAVLGAVDGGEPVERVYLDVLLPAQRESGRLWHAGDLSIAEEHAVTSTTQRAMALLRERAAASAPTGKTAVVTCVAGNVHDIGARAVSDFFEIAGWRTINLGADVPADDIARAAQFFDADVVLLAATLDPHVKATQRAIERIRAERPDAKIIVGGEAFRRVSDLWRKVGADGHAPSVEEAEPLGSRLIGT